MAQEGAVKPINLLCPVCLSETHDHYMVTKKCWNEAGLDFHDNVHLACLAKRLGRPLARNDFVPYPINDGILETGDYDTILQTTR